MPPSEAVCDANGGMFFANRTDGYRYMWANSRRRGPIGRLILLENWGDIVEGGLIVHPTEGYEFNLHGQTDRYRSNTSTISNLNLLPYIFNSSGQRQIVFNDRAFTILAGIHTHPGATSVHLSRYDLRIIGKAYPISFTISTRGIGVGYINENGGVSTNYNVDSLDWLLGGGQLDLSGY